MKPVSRAGQKHAELDWGDDVFSSRVFFSKQPSVFSLPKNWMRFENNRKQSLTVGTSV